MQNEANKAFLEYFRCPSHCAPFKVKGEVSTQEGFFRFGPATCYSGSSAGHLAVSPANALFDASDATELRQNEITFCFNPTEVADNFRRERYLPDNRSANWLRSTYYSFRPVLPTSVRRAIQRSVVSRRLKAPFPTWPVDCSVEQLFQALMEKILLTGTVREVPFIWFWPDGHAAALMMTHDVEQKLGAAHCQMLMDLDDSVGIKAAFQLIPEVRYDCFEELVEAVRARGFEANLHDLNHDGRLYEDLRLFQKRAAKINAYAREYSLNGFRAGAMHRNQEWFDLLDVQYDMSVPSVSHMQPQPGGCCSIMPYFMGDKLELPLTTAQDYELFYILGHASIELWKQQIETIRAHHGLISFIVHPDYIVAAEERNLYCQLLSYLAESRRKQEIWWALPGEINLWWRQRGRMKLIKNGNDFEIDGPGSERAQVAYARLSDGQLKYRLGGTKGSDSHFHGAVVGKATGQVAGDNN